jgi:hypothetical protein
MTKGVFRNAFLTYYVPFTECFLSSFVHMFISSFFSVNKRHVGIFLSNRDIVATEDVARVFKKQKINFYCAVGVHSGFGNHAGI